MPYTDEQQRTWQPECHLPIADAIREAMSDGSPTKRAKSPRSIRHTLRPTVETPSDLPNPSQPHIPLRMASVQSKMHNRKGSVPMPLFAPTRGINLRGFSPSPVEAPLPRLDNINASSEHAFAPREGRKRFQPALNTLENQQTVLQYAERNPSLPVLSDIRPPSSPIMPTPRSPDSPHGMGKGLKGSKSMGDGLRNMMHRVSSKQGEANGRSTPDSLKSPTLPAASDEIRESFRSALTSHDSFGLASSINTAPTTASGRSSPNSFVKVRREDWERGSVADVDMSVEDAIGMYENGFSSAPDSAKASLDIRAMRSEGGRLTPEMRSIRSLQLERPASQPQLSQPAHSITSQPATPTKASSKRPNITHRRSKSASILLLRTPKSQRSGSSPDPNMRKPAGLSAGEDPPSLDMASSHKQSPPSDKVARDRYGFKKANQYISVEQYDKWDKHYCRHVERRTKKWLAMMRSYGLTTDPPIRFPPKSDKIKRYVRKGIPPEFRGAAWFWYAGGPGKLAKDQGLYWRLVEDAKPENEILSDSDREHIERDLNRTFPDNIRFKPDPSTLHDAQAGAGGGAPTETTPDSKKKRNRQTIEAETPILQALRRLLQAFAIHNPNIGYCQSLNFIAGLLLLFLDEDEEKAFVLLNIVTSQHLPGTHGVALEGANIDIGVLMSCIKDTLPAVWAKLDDKGGATTTHNSIGNGLASAGAIGGATALRLPTVSLATTAWFMSLFVGTLPIEGVLRVWDCLFFEGSKTLFRIALSIFKLGEPQIVAVNDPMEVFQLVQTIPRGMLDVNGLMETCFRRRGGFGGVSQGLIERRRAERRLIVKEGVAREVLQDDAAGGAGGLAKLRGRLRRTTVKG